MIHITLLQPFFWSLRNRLRPQNVTIPWRTVFLISFSALLCLVFFLATTKVVRFFHSQNELGIILSLKIFQMAWITLFAMLVFSCMVSSISALFLSSDNEIVFSAPVSPQQIYFMRFSTTFLYTSWMMILFSLPVFFAFGTIFEAGLLFFPFVLVAILATALSAVGFGTSLTVLLVNIFPAKRTKDIVFYLSLCFAAFIYAMFRLMRPEELANPEKFGHFIDYLSSISGTTGPYVPGGWAADFLITYLMDRNIDWLLFGLITITPIALFILGEWLMGRFFFSGFSKAQESFGGYQRFKSSATSTTSTLLSTIRKEVKSFLRDSAEWSQLFMIGALIIVYLYNFKALPLERSFWREEYLANLVAFLNIGLTGFIITSLAARFVYPSVGAEGGAFFIIRSSPLSMKKFILYKYIFYSVPFSLLSLALILSSDSLLGISGPLFWISLISGVIMAQIIVGLALGFGSMYADFKVENKAAAIGSIGAIFFLLVSLALESVILASLALPSYSITKRWLKALPIQESDLVLLFISGALSFGLAVLLVWWTMKKGLERLEEQHT